MINSEFKYSADFDQLLLKYGEELVQEMDLESEIIQDEIEEPKITKSEKNKIKKELKDDTMKLINEVEDNIKVRTRNDYFFELENADKINVISRIQRELKKIKSALKIAKPGEQLTKQKTNEIIKAEKTRKDNLLSEIRHAKRRRTS